MFVWLYFCSFMCLSICILEHMHVFLFVYVCYHFVSFIICLCAKYLHFCPSPSQFSIIFFRNFMFVFISFSRSFHEFIMTSPSVFKSRARFKSPLASI